MVEFEGTDICVPTRVIMGIPPDVSSLTGRGETAFPRFAGRSREGGVARVQKGQKIIGEQRDGGRVSGRTAAAGKTAGIELPEKPGSGRMPAD